MDDFDRFTEVSGAWGIELPPTPFDGNVGSAISALDLDGDGDVDLAVTALGSLVTLFENVGPGHFKRREIEGTDLRGRTHWFADLDDDGLPELFVGLEDGFTVFANRGALDFEQDLVEDGLGCEVLGASVGEIDGAPGLDLVLGTGRTTSMDSHCPELVMTRDHPGWELVQTLQPAGFPALGRGGVITDRDGDGDFDILALQEQGTGDTKPLQGWYRNDGDGLVLDADSSGAALYASGMGVAIGDLNEDGDLDYIISDSARLRVLLSDGAGGWYQGDDLQPERDPNEWEGWSVELADFDADGWLDLVSSAGPAGPMEAPSLADALPGQEGQGQEGQGQAFTERSELLGLEELAHYGLVAADLDGDGFLELATVGARDPMRVWDNSCGSGAWLVVDLEGPPGNLAGLGARVDLVAGQRSWTGELSGPRALGQGPDELHFGLGEAEVADELRVTWPDGEQQVFEDLPLRRRVVVVHPRAG